MEETNNLQEVLEIIHQRFFLIIITTIIGVIIAVILSFYIITPIYDAETQILVNQNSSESEVYSWTQMETDIQLIKTYNAIIKSPVIISEVIDRLKLNIEPEQLTQQITLSSEDDSKVFNIRVQENNPILAASIANGIAEVFQEKIPTIMNMDNVYILSVAKISKAPIPIKPNKKSYIVIGAITGLMLGIGLALLLETLDSTIKDEKDIEDTLGMPIIGVVGVIPIEKEGKSNFKTHNVRSKRNVGFEK